MHSIFKGPCKIQTLIAQYDTPKSTKRNRHKYDVTKLFITLFIKMISPRNAKLPLRYGQ